MQLSDRNFYTRKALSQSLEGIWQYPLTVVEAPMGYGKTTAVNAEEAAYLQTYSEGWTAPFTFAFSATGKPGGLSSKRPIFTRSLRRSSIGPVRRKWKSFY